MLCLKKSGALLVFYLTTLTGWMLWVAVLLPPCQAGDLTDQRQGKTPSFFFGRAWFEGVPVGISQHTLKDHENEPTVFVDVPFDLRADGPLWKWGGPNAEDVGIVYTYTNKSTAGSF